MTDNLRDRIAKAIATKGVSDRDGHWDHLGQDLRDTYLTDADAVISELKPELTRHDTGCVCTECWHNR